MNSLAPGTRIASYEVVRTLSDEGQFSLVYGARSLVDHAEVAIKENFPCMVARRSADGTTVRKRRSADYDWALNRFEREVAFLRSCRHPNIVRVLAPPIRRNNTCYMVMECLSGGSLRKQITALGVQDEARVRSWLIPVLSALEAIEREDCNHLDLSPDNIVFRTDSSPVLIDFGSARFGALAPTRSSRIITNDGYSAPEKGTKTSQEIDARADVYSLAAIVNFAMTGVDPIPSHDRVGGLSGLPPEAGKRRGTPGFLAAIDKGFAFHMASRHANAAAFRKALQEQGDSASRLSSHGSPREPVPGNRGQDENDSVDRHRRAAILLLLLFGFFCALTMFLLWPDRTSP